VLYFVILQMQVIRADEVLDAEACSTSLSTPRHASCCIASTLTKDDLTPCASLMFWYSTLFLFVLCVSLSQTQVAEADEVLDDEALQQLLGGSSFDAKAAPTTGGGWAGSSFWKYKSAAAAIARLGGGSAAAAKKAPAASSKSR
jgi:hypothetical protein